MLDNAEVAILTKVNELADRHGLKPYDFVATIRTKGTNKSALGFEIPAQGNQLREERYNKMISGLGADEEGCLEGSIAKIIDSLDDALQIAPKPHRRF
jgi:hypothetical protein